MEDVGSGGFETKGIGLWIEAFGPERSVAWPAFVAAIENYLRAHHPEELQGPVPLEQVLRFLMDRSEANVARDKVGLDEWVRFLYRLGPLDACIGKGTRSFFTPQGEMVPWFHGAVSRQRAKEILSGQEHGGGRPGSFLVRFSESSPKNFTLAYLDEADCGAAGGGKYKNVLVYNRGPWGFALEAESPQAACYATLRELIDCRQGWSVPCLSALATEFSQRALSSSSRSTGTGSSSAASANGLLARGGSSSGSLRPVGVEESGATTPDALRASSPTSNQDSAGAAAIAAAAATPPAILLEAAGSSLDGSMVRRRSGSGSSSLGMTAGSGGRRVPLGRSHTSAPGSGLGATPPTGPVGWGRSVSFKPGAGGDQHPQPIGGPLRAHSLMIRSSSGGSSSSSRHRHASSKGGQPPPRFGRGNSGSLAALDLPERASSFSSSISEEGVGGSASGLLPRDESTVILDSDMGSSASSASEDEGVGGGGRRRSRKLRSGAGNGGRFDVDSPVFSPEMEGVSVSGLGGQGIGEEQDEEGSEVVAGGGRGQRRGPALPLEGSYGYDSHVSSRGSSPERVLGQRRRRRRGRRRRGSSVGGLETEEEGAGMEDTEEEEEEDDDDEEGIPEPSEAELRRRLTLLHTMSSVGSVDEATRLLDRAMVVVAGGRYEEALGLLDEALGVAGAETCAREEAAVQVKAAKVKGTVLQEMGLPREASLWFELCARAGLRVLQLTPAEEDLGEQFPPLRYAHKQLAQFYLSVQAYPLVVEHFEHLLALTDDAGERRLLFRDFERLSLEFDFWRDDVTPALLERELDLGKQWYREKSFEEAALQFRRVVQMARLTPSADRLVEARALGNHATVLRDLNKLDEAILAYRFCCRILGALGERQLERRMLNGLSLCYIEAGRHADARSVCEGLLALTEREDNVELIRKRLEEVKAHLKEAGVDVGGKEEEEGFVVGNSMGREESPVEKGDEDREHKKEEPKPPSAPSGQEEVNPSAS